MRIGTRRIGIPSGAAGAASFVPTSIGGLVLWLPADRGITLNGSTVSAWADQSGSGDANKNVAQASGTNQPTFVASDADFGNKPCLSFDGGDHMLSGTWAAALSQPATWYVVAKVTTGGAVRYFMDGIAVGNRHALHSIAADRPSLFAGTATISDTTSVTTVAHVYCFVVNGASSAIYVDDSQTAKVTGSIGTHTLTGTRIGAVYNATNPLIGKGAEWIGYSSAHSAATRQTVMRGLGVKYTLATT